MVVQDKGCRNPNSLGGALGQYAVILSIDRRGRPGYPPLYCGVLAHPRSLTSPLSIVQESGPAGVIELNTVTNVVEVPQQGYRWRNSNGTSGGNDSVRVAVTDAHVLQEQRQVQVRGRYEQSCLRVLRSHADRMPQLDHSHSIERRPCSQGHEHERQQLGGGRVGHGEAERRRATTRGEAAITAGRGRRAPRAATADSCGRDCTARISAQGIGQYVGRQVAATVVHCSQRTGVVLQERRLGESARRHRFEPRYAMQPAVCSGRICIIGLERAAASPRDSSTHS